MAFRRPVLVCRLLLTVFAVLSLSTEAMAQAPSAAVPERPAPPEPPGALSGRVIDPAGRPVPGALVRALALGLGTASEPLAATTAEDGSFAFDEPREKAWRVRVEAKGFAPWNGSEVLAEKPLDVRLGSGRPVTGRVLDASTGQGIAGARLRLSDPGAAEFPDDALLSAVSGEDGRYRFAHAPAGEASIAAVAPGRALARASLRVPAPGASDETTQASDLFLYPGARLAGTVRTPAGSPVKGARVRATPRGFPGGEHAMLETEVRRTANDGAFDFEGLRAGAIYGLSAEKAGFAPPPEVPIEVVAADRTDFRITLSAGATLRFRLRDDAGGSVSLEALRLEPEAEPKLRRPPIEVAVEDVEHEPEGRLSAGRLVPGQYTLVIRPEGSLDLIRQGVELAEGQRTDLGDLQVQRGKVLAGRVTDEQGTSIASAIVTAEWRQDRRRLARQTRTDANGRFRLAGLVAQPLRLIVAASKFVTQAKNGVESSTGDLEIVLEPAGAIRGTITASDGRHLAAVRLLALLDEEALPRQDAGESEFDEESGAFTLSDLGAGTYTVEVRVAGYSTARKEGVAVENGRIADAGEIVLDPGLVLRGRVVRDEDGTAVPAAALRLARSDALAMLRDPASAQGTTASDVDGKFAMGDLSPGAFTLTVEHFDHAPAEVSIELSRERPPTETEIRLFAGGKITGTVRDGERQPVAGEEILLMRGLMGADPRSIATDDEGKYGFPRLAPGSYMVARPRPSGRGPTDAQVKTVNVANAETVVVDFDERSAIRLQGTVRRNDEPIPHARLAFLQGAGATLGDFQTAQADAAGRYEVGLEHAGTYGVNVMSSGTGNSGVARIEVPDEPEVVRDIVVESGRLSGTVVDGDGKPIAGARIAASPEGGETDLFGTPAVAFSRADGAFEILGMGSGGYAVQASAEGFAPAHLGPVSVGAEGAAEGLEIVLEHGRIVHGLVLDSQSRPVRGATVSVSASGASVSSNGSTAFTDADGRFPMSVTESGRVDVSVIAPGWAPSRVRGWIADGKSSEGPTIALSLGGRVRVEVVNASGLPVAGVVVMVLPAEFDPFLLGLVDLPPSTDTTGRALVDHLTPGSYVVHALQAEEIEGVAVDVSEGAESLVRFALRGGAK